MKIGAIKFVTAPRRPSGSTSGTPTSSLLEDLQKKGIKVELVSEDDTGKPQVMADGILFRRQRGK